MEHSNNYKALLVLRKALELHIEVDPSENQYGCNSAGHAQDAICPDDEDVSELVYEVNFRAYEEALVAGGAAWRHHWAYSNETLNPFSTAELRQYRIANFYRAIDLQEKVVAADALEEVLAVYKEKETLRGHSEWMAGFCEHLADVLLYSSGDGRRLDHYALAKKYWTTVGKHRTRFGSLFWFNTVQERIDAVTKLINELKGNTP